MCPQALFLGLELVQFPDLATLVVGTVGLVPSFGYLYSLFKGQTHLTS